MDKLKRIQTLAKEWDAAKNGTIAFELVTPGSSKIFWWKCSENHSWQARFSNRINGANCPYCAHTIPIKGENDLLTLFPAIAADWHPDKNGSLTASDLLSHSNKYVWWKCRAGHEWRAQVNNRTSFNNQCPYCTNKLPIGGETDLSTLYPDIAREWHPTKNGTLKAYDVLPNSNKSVWWICEHHHEWKTKISHRASGTDCPYCSGLRPIIGKTDLLTLFPAIAADWHPAKNADLLPNCVTSQSHKKFWWVCRYGHEWESSVSHRVNGRNCPVCCGRKIVTGINDLATIAPSISTEWDYQKNVDLQPTGISPHSNKSAWWLCIKGHSWKTSINNRANGSGCPFCNQNRLIPEETSLAVINPELSAEWDYVKNAPFTPKDVTAFCNDSHWWICNQGHHWKNSVSNRSNGQDCPFCSGRLAISGQNDLETVNPKLASQWHSSKNGTNKPSHFLPYSNELIWWECEKGHTWQAAIFTRSYGSGCPFCSGHLAISGVNDLETMNPKLASQWHLSKNGDKKPSQFLPYSSELIWWECEQGHSWKATIASRSAGSQCPNCKKRRHHKRHRI